jgi:hypothetical protein
MKKSAKHTLPKKFMFNTLYTPLVKVTYLGESTYGVESSKKKFNDFVSAYDYVSQELGGVADFDADKIMESNPTRYKGFMRTIIDNESNRLCLAYGNHYVIEDLEQSLSYFTKKIAKRYLKDPKDFYNSYTFLNYHPLFWSLFGDINKRGVLFWQTDEGLEKMWHSVYKRKKDGKTIHLLEHGENLEEEVEFEGKILNVPSRHPSHDPNLDVVSTNYEKAIIKLAKRVNKLYDLTGQPRI